MLVLTRRNQERIIIGDGELIVSVVEIRSNAVRIGIKAPHDIPVWREEIWIKRQAEKEASSCTSDSDN